MPVDTARVKSLFLAASDLADPAERAAFLDRECGDDADLRARVEALLRANDAAPGLPVAPAVTVDSAAGKPETADYGDPTARVGAVLAGKYKLVEAIGEGGMGSVFMSQQTEPVKRAVAVKVVKAGMDSRAVLTRFEAERQALAMMDHPNIAKVLDAGTTEGGRPFFVMELVKGTPITRYCDEHKLTPRQRLELFVPVCQAIQHAHQKGIIHRDIKPSNVLVALYDDRPVPKVIDFGVAKAAGQSLTDKTLITGFGAMIGTPEYMSPEQASLNNLDIDTRSDVYSLGVLIYELLTGTTPVDKRSLGKAAVLEILRIVREVDAPRPSAKLSSMDTLPSVAANRGTEPAKLSKLMKGELDWLVMKALEKDRTRRYETANALSRDIQCYLADEVVEARPPSVGYRVSKFVRRHKRQVLAATLVFLALLGGFVGTTLGLFEAWRQEQLARDETTEKEKALVAAAERVKERDEALGKRDAALGKADAALKNANHRLSNSSFLLAVAAYDNRDVDQACLRLDSIEPKHRGWEWHYLRRQSAGGIFTLYHTGIVHSVAFSPDGTTIVAGCDDGTKVWDARTGTPQLELKGLTGSVDSVAFSPDGTRLVTGSRTAKVWDAQTGTLQLELKVDKDFVKSVAFSPDGTRLVTGTYYRTEVWDARTGTPQLELKGHRDVVLSLAFSPDGTRIVTGSQDGTAKVWDSQTGTLQLELKGHYRTVHSVAFSPDGSRIVTGSDGGMKVWEARFGKSQLELATGRGGASNQMYSVAFSPDGTRIVSGSLDKTAKVWDARTGTPLVELKGHTSLVYSVAFSPDGTRIVTGSLDRTAKVWDARTTGTPQLELKGHTGNVVSVAFSLDGTRIVTGSQDWTAKVWDARLGGSPQLELKGHRGVVLGVAFSPDGTRIVTSSVDQTAKVWDARTGMPQLELKGHTGQVQSVAFSPDGMRIVSGSLDQTAKVWDARTGTPLLELKGHTSGVSSVAFSPDGMRIVTGSIDQTAKVWDARTGTPQLELKGRPGAAFAAVHSVAFSSDGTRIVTGSSDRTAKVWDTRTGTPLLELSGHAGAVQSVAFSPDDTRLVTSSSTAKVWDAGTGTPLLDLKGHTGVYSVAVSPDGTRLVTVSADRTAKVWDGRSTSPLQLKGHTGMVHSAAFSPDGTRVVTGSADRTAKVWEARTGTPQLELKGHTNTVLGVAFSPDGTGIVTGSMDQTAKVWDARTGMPQLELKGHRHAVQSVAFSPDGTRIVTGSMDQTAKVWDARTGTALLELKVQAGQVPSVVFSPDGTRIVTRSQDYRAKVWDARTGQELKGEPIPQTLSNHGISADGRFIAHPVGNLVELVPLQPDEEELAYRRVHMQPNLGGYREGYEAARAAKDDFVARFYLNLLPPPEQKILKAQATAEKEIAAGRTPDAVAHLVVVSAARPDDTGLALRVAGLQAWFGQYKELADTCGRALESAKGTSDPVKWDQLARICCLDATLDASGQQAALALARKALPLAEGNLRRTLTLGMAEYRSGHFAQADAALSAAAEGAKNNPSVAGTATFYRAMSLFRQGKEDEARKLATEAAAKMKPLPKDEKNPLAVGASLDDLLLWLAYKEAKKLIKFDPAQQ
jgi:WD40 repeat protein/serine/threonine protein kinase